jgi:hypothetical protein
MRYHERDPVPGEDADPGAVQADGHEPDQDNEKDDVSQPAHERSPATKAILGAEIIIPP